MPPIFEEALYCFVYWCLQNTLGNQSNLCFKFIFFIEKFSLLKNLSPQYLLLTCSSLCSSIYTTIFWAQSYSVIKMCIYVLGQRESRRELYMSICPQVHGLFSFFFPSWLWDKSRNPTPLEVKELKWAPKTNILLRNPHTFN